MSLLDQASCSFIPLIDQPPTDADKPRLKKDAQDEPPLIQSSQLAATVDYESPTSRVTIPSISSMVCLSQSSPHFQARMAAWGSYFQHTTQLFDHMSNGAIEGRPSMDTMVQRPSFASSGSNFRSKSGEGGSSRPPTTSSGFLSPPPLPDDYESPPYKSLEKDDDSLTMLKLGRSWSHPEFYDPQDRYYQESSCQLKSYEDDLKIYNSPISRILPSKTQSSPEVSTRAKRPKLVRLWNTVESRTITSYNSKEEAPTPPAESSLATRISFNSDPEKEQMKNTDYGIKEGSSDVVRIVKDRLKALKLTATSLSTPKEITLRRASSSNRDTSISAPSSNTVLSPSSLGSSDKMTCHDEAINQGGTDKYVITANEINSIIDLVLETVKHSSQQKSKADPLNLSIKPISQSVRKPSVTNKGLIPSSEMSLTSGLSVAAPNIRSSFCQPRGSIDLLKVETNWLKPKTKNERQKSEHEVIWKIQNQGTNSRDTSDKEVTSTKVKGSLPKRRKSRSAFDPENPTASIDDWTFELPSPEIPIIIKSQYRNSIGSSLQTNGPTNESPFAETLASPTNQSLPDDVVSFPALPPRRDTNDWYSPLPDLEPLQQSKSLYCVGVDATCSASQDIGAFWTPSPSSKASCILPDDATVTGSSSGFNPDNASRISWRSTDGSNLRRPSSYSHSLDHHGRGESCSPRRTSRVDGEQRIGSSIGSCNRKKIIVTGKRPEKHVRIASYAPLQKQKPDRAWSPARPPSKCPPTLVLSPPSGKTSWLPVSATDWISKSWSNLKREVSKREKDKTRALESDLLRRNHSVSAATNQAIGICGEDQHPHLCTDTPTEFAEPKWPVLGR